jgi:hypothetical protein
VGGGDVLTLRFRVDAVPAHLVDLFLVKLIHGL